jgi:hypothetical protein
LQRSDDEVEADRAADADRHADARSQRTEDQVQEDRASDASGHRRQYQRCQDNRFATAGELETARSDCLIPQNLDDIHHVIRIKDAFTMANMAEQACVCCEELVVRSDISLFSVFPENKMDPALLSAMQRRLMPKELNYKPSERQIIEYYNLPRVVKQTLDLKLEGIFDSLVLILVAANF